MQENSDNKKGKYTVAGTDIEAVKRLNDHSGMSYNEAKEWIAKSTGGHGTNVYSDTNVEEVKSKNRQTKENE